MLILSFLCMTWQTQQKQTYNEMMYKQLLFSIQISNLSNTILWQ